MNADRFHCWKRNGTQRKVQDQFLSSSISQNHKIDHQDQQVQSHRWSVDHQSKLVQHWRFSTLLFEITQRLRACSRFRRAQRLFFHLRNHFGGGTRGSGPKTMHIMMTAPNTATTTGMTFMGDAIVLLWVVMKEAIAWVGGCGRQTIARRSPHLRAAEMIGELDEGRGGDDLHFRARPGGFGAAGGGADETFAASIGTDRGGAHAARRTSSTSAR